MPYPPPRRKRLTTNHHAQTVVHYTPNTPSHPHTTEVDCTLSNHTGGFATIDPRHAGDTPQRSAYGSNSPHRAQASTKPAQRTPKPAQHAWERRHGITTQAPATPKPAPSQHQSTPKQPQATPTCPTRPTHPPRPTHTKGRRGLSRGTPTRLPAGDTCYLMRVQTTT